MLPLSTVELWASGVGEGNSFYLRLRRRRLWKASFKDELGLPRLRRGTVYQAEETAHTKPRRLERGKSTAWWEKGVIRLSAGSRAGLEEEAEWQSPTHSHRKVFYLISPWPHELHAFLVPI